MVISISDIEKSFKNIFHDSTFQSSNNVYEKTSNGYLMVVDFKNLFLKSTNIIFTKFTFNVDKNKMYLIPNKDNIQQFKYLYDINCNYQVKIFETISDFEKILSNIMNKNIFGKNIKILSNFIKSPSSLINNWFSKNDIRNISVFNVKLDERYKIIPCKSLFFNFIINLNNQIDIKLVIQKESNNNYIFTFKIYDKTITEDRPNLSTLIQVIGETLKMKYI